MRKIDSLTGLRFFAAAAIVLTHSCTGYFFPPGAFAPLNLVGAVPLFFVLSGFVLTINARRYRGDWPRFEVARIARVWPAHMAAILFLLGLMYPYSWSLIDTPDGIRKLIVNVLLLQAWSPDPATNFAFNSPSWSISCEMFFYLAFPPMITILSRRPLIGLATVSAVATITVWAIGDLVPGVDYGWLKYVNPIVNLPSFAVGVAAGILTQRLPPARAGWRIGTVIQSLALLGALAGNIYGVPLVNFVLGAGVVPYAVLIIALARYKGAISATLELPILVYLGEISYSLYLFHQPIIRWHSGYRMLFSAWPWWLQWLAVVAAALMVSATSHHLIERPARRGIIASWRRLRPSPEPGPTLPVCSGSPSTRVG